MKNEERNNLLERNIDAPLKVFCCYARSDVQWLYKIKKHLTALEREGLITLHADIDIIAGEVWESKLHQDLIAAQIILLLISSDFIGSSYCYEREMQQALARHDEGTARVVPIIIRPIDWQGTPLNRLQALPKDAKPISMWRNKDEALLNITDGVRTVIQEFIGNSCHPPISPSKHDKVNAFYLATSIYLLGHHDLLYKENPDIIQLLSVHTKVYAITLRVNFNVDELARSANPEHWIERISQALNGPQSRQAVLGFTLGFVLAAYFVTQGGYPVDEHIRGQVDELEQQLRRVVSLAEVDESLLEDLISACKNLQIDDPREKRDRYIIDVGSKTIEKIATYLESRY